MNKTHDHVVGVVSNGCSSMSEAGSCFRESVRCKLSPGQGPVDNEGSGGRTGGGEIVARTVFSRGNAF